jgi:hypothetical protein
MGWLEWLKAAFLFGFALTHFVVFRIRRTVSATGIDSVGLSCCEIHQIEGGGLAHSELPPAVPLP